MHDAYIMAIVTAAEFNTVLARMELSQAALGRVIRQLSGRSVDKMTLSRWATGRVSVPPLAATVVRLLEQIPARKREKLARNV